MCNKHNVGYTIADIYPECWRGVPRCPYCRKEWMEEHEATWDLPMDYKVMYTQTLLAADKCVALPMTKGRGVPRTTTLRIPDLGVVFLAAESPRSVQAICRVLESHDWEKELGGKQK